MKQKEDIFDKINRYERKFGENIPLFIYNKLEENPKEWSKRIDECFNRGKDMYELGYINNVFKEYANIFNEPMPDFAFVMDNENDRKILYDHIEEIFIMNAKKCLEQGKSFDDLHMSMSEEDVMKYFKEVEKILEKYR